jgi:hypothetical protein
MVNIICYGYSNIEVGPLYEKINKCMEAIGFGCAIKAISFTTPLSCDGAETRSPYLLILVSKSEHVPHILAGFQKFGIYENAWVIPSMFFKASEIALGE